MILALAMGTVFGEKKNLGILSNVMKPDMIQVYGNELYVSQNSTFFVYSLKDLKLLRQFGRKGEGPGELITVQNSPTKIAVSKENILVTGVGKAIFFAKDGKFLKEFRTKQNVMQILRVGKNLVAKELHNIQDQGSITDVMLITLYNSKMEKIKELYRQNSIRQQNKGAMKIDLGMDFVSFSVSKDKIFIEESPKGFFIEVFDSNGKKLYDIKKDYQNRPITSKDKAAIELMMENDPYLKGNLKQFGGWKGFRKLITITYPDTFPAIKGIEVSDEKIFVRTFKVKDDKEEYLVLDLKGKELKKTYISKDLEVSVMAQILGGKLYSISGNNLYYILENEDDQEWELFVETMAP